MILHHVYKLMDMARYSKAIMKKLTSLVAVFALCLNFGYADEGNEKIDYKGFVQLTNDLDKVRKAHRISEDKFIQMSKEEGVIILDARSKAKYDKIHVKGAIHLNFSDFSDASLAKVIPSKKTKILIYCNNNFRGDPINLTAKRIEVPLNIPTFLNLHAYGYKNVYELKPYLDLKTTKIPFAGSKVKKWFFEHSENLLAVLLEKLEVIHA